MSIETMLSFSNHLKMSLDYMMYGIGEPQGQLDLINTTEHTAQACERQTSYLNRLNKEL